MNHVAPIVITLLLSVAAAALYIEHQQTALLLHFSELTQTRGAWSMDREYVAKQCGFDVNDLPSVKK